MCARHPPFELTTPQLLSQLYGLPLNKVPKANTGQRAMVAVASFEGQMWSPKNLQAFLRYFGISSDQSVPRNLEGAAFRNLPLSGSTSGEGQSKEFCHFTVTCQL